MTTNNLLDPCKYSFDDLLKASDQVMDIVDMYTLSQDEINNLVKFLCDKVGWHYKDTKGTDGIIYTAFSPNLDL